MNWGILAAAACVASPPHRVVIDLNTGGAAAFKRTLETIKNLDKAFAPVSVQVEVVCRGDAVGLLLVKNPLARRVAAQLSKGARFSACGNTLRTWHAGKERLIPGVAIVDAGVAEVVRREEQGWSYLKGG